MERKYHNQYVQGDNHVCLHISGGKYEATLLIEKEDFPVVSKVNWGLMAVGREGNKKLIPYTVVNRVSVPLGRWLLNVHHSEKRVEHRDRNNHNFLRHNLYVNDKHDYKQQKSSCQENSICGIFEVKQKNGNITGYKVQYVCHETFKKKWACFSSRKCNGLDHAMQEAVAFRMSLVQNTIETVSA